MLKDHNAVTPVRIESSTLPLSHYAPYGHVAYQIKGKEVQTNIETEPLTLHTPLTSGSVKRSDIEIVQISIFLLN